MTAPVTTETLRAFFFEGDVAALVSELGGKDADWKAIFIQWVESLTGFGQEGWPLLIMMVLLNKPFEVDGEL